jgi:hypothetical protein
MSSRSIGREHPGENVSPATPYLALDLLKPVQLLAGCLSGRSEPGNVPAGCRAHEDGAACDGPACRPECRRTALPNRARSVVGEHPGGLNDTGTDAGSVLNAELAGSAPPQTDRIVR